MASTVRTMLNEQYARYMQGREAILARIAALEVTMGEKEQEVKKSSWKWAKIVGAPLPIRKVLAEMAEEQAALEAFEKANTVIVDMMEEYRIWDAEEEEMRIWALGGPAPGYILRAREEEEAAYLAECDVLPIIKTY